MGTARNGKNHFGANYGTGKQAPVLHVKRYQFRGERHPEVIDKAKQSGGLFTAKNPILFIDEIHRFSKSQQDSSLAAVEKGSVTLIGVTTENPSFEVIPALLSRCQVYILNAFTKDDLEALLHRAIETDTILKSKDIQLKETEALLRLSGGDGRKLLNIFELIINASESDSIEITNDKVMQLVQKNTVLYDKTGEQHYDIVSAFIKSIRGSDPNGAVYWLARMIEGGEDVKFIARRMLILASEDIGNANPTALIYGQQHLSGGYHYWLSRKPHSIEPMRDLSGDFCQKQCKLYGYRQSATNCQTNGRLTRTVTFAQRPYQTDERIGIWGRIQIRTRFCEQFCRTGISSG